MPVRLRVLSVAVPALLVGCASPERPPEPDMTASSLEPAPVPAPLRTWALPLSPLGKWVVGLGGPLVQLAAAKGNEAASGR